jgi:hypothetical protein
MGEINITKILSASLPHLSFTHYNVLNKRASSSIWTYTEASLRTFERAIHLTEHIKDIRKRFFQEYGDK